MSVVVGNGIYTEKNMHGRKLLHYKKRSGRKERKKKLIADQFSNPNIVKSYI